MEPAIVGVSLVGQNRIAPNDTKDLLDTISNICFPSKDFSQIT